MHIPESHLLDPAPVFARWLLVALFVLVPDSAHLGFSFAMRNSRDAAGTFLGCCTIQRVKPWLVRGMGMRTSPVQTPGVDGVGRSPLGWGYFRAELSSAVRLRICQRGREGCCAL